MPTKHIAFIVKYFPTVSETFIVNQINGLMDEGHMVSLYAYQQGHTTVVHESLKRYVLLKKVNYFIKPPASRPKRLMVLLRWTFSHFFKIKWHLYFSALNVFKNGREAYTLKLFFEAQWFLVSNDIALIHAHFGMNGNRIAYLKTFGILPTNLPLITTFHGYDLKPDQLQKYIKGYKFLFKEAAAFTVNTPYLDYLLKQVNHKNIPVHILPVGLDTDFFKRSQPKKQDTYFDLVFCGKLIPLKGPDLAIDAVKKLHVLGHKQVRLYLIGHGMMLYQLEKQVEALQLQNSVLFFGAQSQTQLLNHLEQADAFVLPGRYEVDTGRAETQGLVIQEAQAMGLPVIVSDVGGMKYGLLPNKSGFVVGENDVDGLVNAILKLIENPDVKTKMGNAGRAFVEKKYDEKVLTQSLLEIYEVSGYSN